MVGWESSFPKLSGSDSFWGEGSRKALPLAPRLTSLLSLSWKGRRVEGTLHNLGPFGRGSTILQLQRIGCCKHRLGLGCGVARQREIKKEGVWCSRMGCLRGSSSWLRCFCVAQSTGDFHTNEWRLVLPQGRLLWKNFPSIPTQQ